MKLIAQRAGRLARWSRIAALAGAALCAPAAQALDIDLGNAAAYAGFIFEDASGLNTSLGRLAVGGNLSLAQAEIGAGAPDMASVPSLVVRGNFSAYTSGAFWSGALPGFGLYLGTKAASTGANLDLRKVTSLPVNFEAERTYLGVMSEQLRDLPASGQVTLSGGVLTLAGTQAPLEVFTLTAAQAAGTQTVQVADVRADAHIVINITADAVRRIGFGVDTAALAPWKGRVLLNAHDAETVQFNQLTFWASVLAPNACICNSSGRLEGSVVARKWSATMTIAHTPFVPKP